MKKTILIVLTLVLAVMARDKLPGNVIAVVCSANVKQDSTSYTNPVSLANMAYRVGAVIYKDTNIVKQDTLDIGTGVKIKQELGIVSGNLFSRTYSDTLWRQIGDTNSIDFVNWSTLSGDSLICSVLDTGSCTLTPLGNGDTLWVSDGYFNLQPDPAPISRFSITGNAAFGTTIKKVYVLLNVLLGEATTTERY